jgi:hypothetical protein
VDLDHERLPLHSDERVTYSKFISMSFIAFLLLIDNFGEVMRLIGPRLIPFWCLMPKGEKIRPKQEMDELPLENFENSRVRVFVLAKSS